MLSLSHTFWLPALRYGHRLRDGDLNWLCDGKFSSSWQTGNEASHAAADVLVLKNGGTIVNGSSPDCMLLAGRYRVTSPTGVHTTLNLSINVVWNDGNGRPCTLTIPDLLAKKDQENCGRDHYGCCKAAQHSPCPAGRGDVSIRRGVVFG